MDPEAATIQLPKAWVKVDESAVLAANDFLLLPGTAKQAGGPLEEYVLIVGHSAAPLLFGTPEEVMEQAKGMDFVPVQTLARFSITPSSLRELARLLSEMEAKTNT